MLMPASTVAGELARICRCCRWRREPDFDGTRPDLRERRGFVAALLEKIIAETVGRAYQIAEEVLLDLRDRAQI